MKTSLPSRILVVLVAGIGDLVMASMALRAIRNGYPLAELHLLTSEDAARIGRHYPYLDRVWPFPIRRLRKSRRALAEVPGALRRLRALRFEKIVNLYQVADPVGALKMGLVFSALRSPCKIGHDRYGFGVFLDRKVPPDFFQGRHMAESFLDMACLAGGQPDEKRLEVFHLGTSNLALKEVFAEHPGRSSMKRVAVNPGSDMKQKRVDPSIFAAAVNTLGDHCLLQTIVLGGPGEEAIAAKLVRRLKRPAVNLAGKTSLEDLVYVIDHVDLLITNDSGPMHIAAAMGKPLVALFSGGDPAVFGPYGDEGRFRILKISRGSAEGPFRAAASAKVAAMGEELLCR